MNQKSAVRAFFALPPHLVELVRTTAGAFAVLLAVGFTLGSLRPEAVEPLMRMFTNAAAGAGLYQVEGASLMALILANNLLSLLLVIAGGLVPFLRLPAFSLGLNAGWPRSTSGRGWGSPPTLPAHCPTRSRSWARWCSPAPRGCISAAR